MNEITKQLIESSTDINSVTKSALSLYIESSTTFDNSTFKGDCLVDLKQVSHLEGVHAELKRCFSLNFSHINYFKRNVLAARLSSEFAGRSVFAKVIENKFFEQITTYEGNKVFSYKGVKMPTDLWEVVQKMSKTLNASISKGNIANKSKAIYHELSTTVQEGGITDLDYKIIERVCIDLFANNYETFTLFMDKIDSIENLSSVIFNGITFKLCLKLSPLLAGKFISSCNTDETIRTFFKKVYTKARFQHFFGTGFGRTQQFLSDYKQTITYGFLGITVGSLVTAKAYSLINPIVVTHNKLIVPAVQAFVGVMQAITNSKLIVYTMTNRVSEVANAFYRGVRDNLVQSVLDFLRQAKQESVLPKSGTSLRGSK